MNREQQALGPPADDLRDFPVWRLRRTQRLWRAHRRELSPWWFCSDMSCRFDLASPHGTCYLGLTAGVAVRERLGERLVHQGVVTTKWADSFAVSELRVLRGRRLADTTHSKAADHGVTRELATLTPYELPQQWAAAFHRDGFPGLRYHSRFSPGRSGLAVALFGDEGGRGWPTVGRPVRGRQAARAAGVQVVDPPRMSHLRITRPT